MMVQAFIVDATTLAVAQRMKVPTLATLQQFPFGPNQAALVYPGPEDIENLEPQKDAQDIVQFVPRVVPQANRLLLAKLAKRNEINDKRDQLWNGTCQTPKGAVNCDELSRNNMMSAIAALRERAALSLPVSGRTWTMADNTDVFHTVAELRQLFVTVDQFIDNVQAKSRELKLTLLNANTVAAVQAIDVQGAAWPV